MFFSGAHKNISPLKPRSLLTFFFMDKQVLEVKNLTKKFGSFTAVDDISFSMGDGEILGFLGPNGAGKTTTIQMLLGALSYTDGEISFFGKDFKNHREEILEKVNFSSTYTNLVWNLTVKENLTFISYLYDIKNRKGKIKEVIDIFRLPELANKKLHELSAGQLTRVNLAKAFINSPKVLLLDEPTASLDPDVASYIREFLLEERKKFNVSIILTSHNMAEVEEVCDRVIFINRGKIVANDTPEVLVKTIEISHIELRLEKDIQKIIEYCKKNEIVHRTHGKKYIVVDINEKAIPRFLQTITEKNIVYDEISIEKPSLEDYFLQVTTKKHEMA